MSYNQNSPPHIKGFSTYSQQSTTPCCSSSSYATSVDWDNISIEDNNDNALINGHHLMDATAARELRMENALMRAEINTLRAVITYHNQNYRVPRLMQRRILMSELNENWSRRNNKFIPSRHLAAASDVDNDNRGPDEMECELNGDNDLGGENIPIQEDLFQPPDKCPSAAVVRDCQQWEGAGFTHNYGMLPANQRYYMRWQIKPAISCLDRLKDFCCFLLLLFSFLVMYGVQNAIIIAIVGWPAFVYFRMWKLFGFGFVLNMAFFHILPFLYALIMGRKFYRQNWLVNRLMVYWGVTTFLVFIPYVYFLFRQYSLGHPLLTPPEFDFTKFAPTFDLVCDNGVGRNQQCHREPRQYEDVFVLVFACSWFTVNAPDAFSLPWTFE